MLGRELRLKFTQFFVEKGAVHLPSDSLVPNDPTLLFTSAGMVQFKPYFLGQATPSHTRATTVQKCLRTTDIESVGDTSHCTFFEMLGNFSFGDYFKKEAIAYAWEFLFNVLGLDIERIRVTIFLDDDEAYELWRTQGMPDRKIFRMGEEDNFWAAGPVGPCGPDSEIFYDTQAHLPPTPDGVWDDKRWLEIWNLVFMQFNQDETGKRTLLPRKNIDTGSGLERTTAVLNDLRGPFETDLFAPLLEKLQSLSGKTYGSQDHDSTDIAFRRVADHVRASTFCIADGILPSNVGRGYVLRRLLRRAILAGRNTLGFDKPFLTDAIPTIIDQYAEFYPELPAKKDTILRYVSAEEGQFRRTLESGTARLEAILETRTDGEQVTGEEAFTLFTTYGFPVEMTRELASEKGIRVDQSGYEAKMAEHAVISEGGKGKAVYGSDVASQLRELGIAETKFVGYSDTTSTGIVVAVLQNGKSVESVSEGDEVQIVLDETPFYAESGGQVADTGLINAPLGVFEVTDTQKAGGYFFHSGVVHSGEIHHGDTVSLQVNDQRRLNIQRNHSTTHLLHKALQLTLGSHVQQRGSQVGPDKLRFDFSHDKALTPAEISRVEAIVNDEILADLPIETLEKPIDEAKQMGAMMLFGEKYGTVVRVVKMGEFSVEFCGGIHLNHTSQAGLMRIVSEGSTQSGVRRIEAVTGGSALRYAWEDRATLQHAASVLKTSPAHVLETVERLQSELKAKSKDLAAALKLSSLTIVEQLVANVEPIGGTKLVVHKVDMVADSDGLRSMADEVVNRLGSGIAILAAEVDGRALLAVKVSKDNIDKGVHAGNLVKQTAPIVGGGGGGRPDAAQAGGKEPARLIDALNSAKEIVLSQLV